MNSKKSLGLYLHVPFCVQKCRYCDFCSVAGSSSEKISEYCRTLALKIDEFAKRAGDFCVDTVYFGGGTPSLMSLGDAECLMDVITSKYDGRKTLSYVVSLLKYLYVSNEYLLPAVLSISEIFMLSRCISLKAV